jgi:hypothetical protein
MAANKVTAVHEPGFFLSYDFEPSWAGDGSFSFSNVPEPGRTDVQHRPAKAARYRQRRVQRMATPAVVATAQPSPPQGGVSRGLMT